MIRFKPWILGASIVLLPLLSNLSVLTQNQSQKIELKVYSQNEQKQSCPEKVIVTEQTNKNHTRECSRCG
ncbi:hypothetical protein [Nostoc sp. CALU 546]|uniref:hypothetical protein n=1 Tax=Nostoc sp. CALU 546 TaxID=1867241 RepID=UPI003B67A40F